jgi:hypothetical protein
MTRNEMQAFARENPAALDPCHDVDCAAVGRLLGADLVVDGEFTLVRGLLTLNLRTVDTRTGRQIAATRIASRAGRDLLDEVEAIAPVLLPIPQDLRAVR